MRIADTLQPESEPLILPRPRRPWWAILYYVGGVILTVALLAVLSLVLVGCGSEVPAKTWPEVVDRHWFATGCLIAWTVFWLAVVIGGIRIRLSKPEGGQS